MLFYLVQLQKTEDERPDVKEFDHLKDHFEKNLRLPPSTTLPSSLLSIPGMNSFSSRYAGTGFAHAQQKSDDVASYHAIVKVETESGLVDDLVQLRDVNQSIKFSIKSLFFYKKKKNNNNNFLIFLISIISISYYIGSKNESA